MINIKKHIDLDANRAPREFREDFQESEDAYNLLVSLVENKAEKHVAIMTGVIFSLADYMEALRETEPVTALLLRTMIQDLIL